MDYKKLNEILKDLQGLRIKQNRLENIVVKKIDGEGNQGDEGESYEIYPTSIDGVFLKLKITTDSYGDNASIAGVEFVSPIEKTVTNYEPIN